MKFDKQTIVINSVVLVLFSILAGMSGGWVAIGIVAFLIGVADLGIGFILALLRKRNAGLTLLVYAGVLLLIGFSICSTNPFNIQ